jgi:AAA+ ATPase superfamily predicted ATPase
LSKTGALFEEPEFLLQSELKEPRRYAAIVAAIARGGTKLGQVVNRVPGIKDTAQITPYLEPLIRMRIIERIRSLDADENSRDNRYCVSDPLFRFYYRFILPNASRIQMGWPLGALSRLDDADRAFACPWRHLGDWETYQLQ